MADGTWPPEAMSGIHERTPHPGGRPRSKHRRCQGPCKLQIRLTDFDTPNARWCRDCKALRRAAAAERRKLTHGSLAERLPERIGDRTLVARAIRYQPRWDRPAGISQAEYRCVCGEQQWLAVYEAVAGTAPPRCKWCSSAGRRKPGYRLRSTHRELTEPELEVRRERRNRFKQLPWLEDHDARALIVHHGGECTLEQIGDFYGLTRERIRQIEASAITKLRRIMRFAGMSASDYNRDALRTMLDAQQRPSSKRAIAA